MNAKWAVLPLHHRSDNHQIWIYRLLFLLVVQSTRIQMDINQ